jgi:uncharacterized protein
VQVSDQKEVCAFLSSQMAARGGFEEIETHISRLFIGPEIAWKLKRAVKLPYAEFDTPERRLSMCEREVTLNRRTAPAYYLGVRRITRTEGNLEFDGSGELIDAVVEMQRFDQNALFDRMATRGALSSMLMERLAVEIAHLHQTSEPDIRPGSDRVAEVLAVNEAALAQTRVFRADEVQAFNTAFRREAEELAPRLDARGFAGRVRRAHGDLHLRNIFVEENRPVIFDCIEFNDTLATVDLLYDLAFLLMDLVHRGLSVFANLVMNRYLDLADDEAGLPCLPFFMALRAAVRAHVTATAIEEGDDTPDRRQEARTYFDLALDLLRPRQAVLVAIGGLSGTGKSTLAGFVAPMLGAGAGARTISSDRVRKALHGVAPETRLPPEAYLPEVSAEVYAALESRAEALVAAGVSVVADAVFAKADERHRIEAAALIAGKQFCGIWLDASARTLRERVASRKGGPSDADVAVLEAQLAYDLGQLRWTRLEATGTPDALASTIRDTALKVAG